MTEFLTKILEKYNLQENLEWQINGQKEPIIKELKCLTSENYYSTLFAVLDLTAPKDKKYIGTITNNGFLIRQRIRPFDLLPNMAKVSAEFKIVNGKTKLIAKVNGMRTILLIVRLVFLTLLSFLAFIILLIALISIGEVNPFPSLLILIFISAVFVLIPWLLGQRNVRNMKTELNKILEHKTTYNTI